MVKNTGVVQLPSNDPTALLGAVATVGPVSISVDAGGQGWSYYAGGVYTDACGFDVDHAVQLVGYGEDSGNLYWLVRNSWGSGWGEGGYIRLQRFSDGTSTGASEPCGVDSTPQDGMACAGDTAPVTYCGKCAVLSASSYPTGGGKGDGGRLKNARTKDLSQKRRTERVESHKRSRSKILAPTPNLWGL